MKKKYILFIAWIFSVYPFLLSAQSDSDTIIKSADKCREWHLFLKNPPRLTLEHRLDPCRDSLFIATLNAMKSSFSADADGNVIDTVKSNVTDTANTGADKRFIRIGVASPEQPLNIRRGLNGL